LLDQQVDILAHLLDRLDVVAVLLIDLPFELLDELHFVCDNLRACCLLRLDVLSKLLAIFLFFKLLPVPINFDVFLVGLDNFVLDLVRSLFFVAFFSSATFLVSLLGIDLDLDDFLLGLAAELLQLAFSFLDARVTVSGNLDALRYNFLIGFGHISL